MLLLLNIDHLSQNSVPHLIFFFLKPIIFFSETGRYVSIVNVVILILSKPNIVVRIYIFYFLLVCPAYNNLRVKYLPIYTFCAPTINKFINRISTTSQDLLNLLTYFNPLKE